VARFCCLAAISEVTSFILMPRRRDINSHNSNKHTQQRSSALICARRFLVCKPTLEGCQEQTCRIRATSPTATCLQDPFKSCSSAQLCFVCICTCRFLVCKPTLEGCQEQARTTHAWRISRRVDGVMQRPAPHFHSFQGLLCIHVLGCSPEGHAVILVKVSRCLVMLPVECSVFLRHKQT
jgi:hypothetical protein